MVSALSSLRIQISVFLISAVLLSYQILLVKLFSIQYWYHFAYLIISIALLGFGASGTFITLFTRQLGNRLSIALFACPLLLVVSMWTGIYLNRFISFNPLMIAWHPQEIVNFLFLSLAIFVPFFLGALCIGISFVSVPDHIHRIYFTNLTGSGLGGLVVVLFFFHVSPYGIMFIISLVSLGAALVACTNRINLGIIGTAGIALIVLYTVLFRFVPLPMSAFKDLSLAENLTGAQKETEVFGPLGLVTVLGSPAYHYLPDLSLRCPYPLPRQKGLFLDGNTLGAINEFSGNVNDIRIMDFRTNALAYTQIDHPEVLIIGGGSGTEILNALSHKAKRITVVEMNDDIVHMMRGRYGTFSGNIYRTADTRVFIEDGRGFLQRTRERFDLIHISPLEAMGTASAGVASLSENYLFTTEAFTLCMDRLTKGGILSISSWIRNPPRDTLKLLAMAIEAVKRHGASPPDRSIVMIRSWQTATLLVKNGVFNHNDIHVVKEFCKERLFDISYCPGIHEQETNTFNILEEDFFYHAARSLLSEECEKFYDAYPFYIRPATDDRPFYSHFFKMDMLKEFLVSANRAFIPFLDWGYILVLITACILFLLAMIFILAPLTRMLPSQKGLMSVFLYFGSLGIAYMFIEISVLQQFIRYLYDPVFSASIVIGSFLVYSGIGSAIAGRGRLRESKYIFLPALAIGISGFILLSFDGWLEGAIAGFPLWLRMLSCSACIAPLAVSMGIPFPSGLSALAAERKELIPWAWSINGFFSVIGSSTAVLIAIGYGFKSTFVIAIVLYILAACMYSRLHK